MAANPNTFSYWLRGGSVLPKPTLGKVAGTADFNYWQRDGMVGLGAAIQPIPATAAAGDFFLVMGL